MKDDKTKRVYGIIAVLILVGITVFISWQVGIVHNCEPLGADKAVQQWFLNLRNDVLNVVVTAITHMGDTTTIVILCAIIILSPIPGRKNYGLPVTLAALGGLTIYKPMKHWFLRARPEEALHLVEQGGYSFPSGHSVTSVVVYGLLFYLIRKHCKNPKLRCLLSGICLFLAVFIGPSRLYVGVHWFTDVMTGWAIGGAVLATAILILERMDERHENI